MSERLEEFFVSSKGLSRTSAIESEPFWFVVGDREFKCSTFQALFISQAVDRVLRSDNTVNRFRIDLNADFFGDICSLMEGRSVILNEKNCSYMRKIARLLENEELLQKAMDFGFGKGKISIANCTGRLKIKEQDGCSTEKEVEFIASHFYEINTNKLKDLNPETIESILSHERLCLSSEDSLLEFIRSLGNEYSFLYGYVDCCFLTVEGIETFLALVEELGIDGRIWNSICRGLRSEVSSRTLLTNRFSALMESKDYGYTGHKFEGIIHDLTMKCGGNVHVKGLVSITASSKGYNNVYEVVDYGRTVYWSSSPFSNGIPNSWICFDFKDSGVALTHYTLKSSNLDGYHPLAWVMEGSNDNMNWTTLDSRITQELNGPNRVKNFECSNKCSECFRYIRLRQTGNNSRNYQLVICNIELFGRLKGK
jgi:hypothetical protein